jgi:adenine-specific DNA-methyltransferase
MIKYIGSKRVLLPRILETIRSLPEVHRVLDLFSGTARVGHALKRAGYDVVANDHNAYAHVLARCYVQADRDRIGRDAERLVAELSSARPRAGYFTETFCVRSRFFHPKNGEKIDAIREAIARKSLDPDLEAVLLASLMEAADRVDSTTGVQMAYLKQWAPRALNDITLRVPKVLPGQGAALRADAIDAARVFRGDLAYLDPPYNQHSYLGNYHVWESLVRWDKPEVYGVACKRIECKTYRSPFNSKRTIQEALRGVVEALRVKYLLVSFNNEGLVEREEMEGILSSRGRVRVFETAFKRYVGAQIGIYNPAGEKVGRVGHLTNKEYLYLVTPKRGGRRSEGTTPPEPPARASSPDSRSSRRPRSPGERTGPGSARRAR